MTNKYVTDKDIGDALSIRVGKLRVNVDNRTVKIVNNELTASGGGIKDGNLNDSLILELENNDGSIVEIDLSKLRNTDTYVVSGAWDTNNILNLTRNDNQVISIDLSAFKTTDDFVVSGEVKPNYVLELTRKEGGKVPIDIGNLKGENGKDGKDGKDGEKGDKGDPGTDRLIERYRINTVDTDYTTLPADFDGATVIRANKNGDQSITITKPPAELEESFRGCCLIIRKSNGDAGTFTNLLAGDGVVFSPDDITPLRRIGNYAGLMYIGNGLYDAGGELP